MDDAGPAELTVRVAEDADLPVLDRVIPTGRNDLHAGFLRRQAAGEATYLLAWRGDQPVGTGVIRWRGRGPQPDPEITNLHVPAPMQSQGIGTAIIRRAEELVRERGHALVVIGVDEDNPRAAALYLRLGYTDTGKRWTGSYTWYDVDGREYEETEHVRVLTRELG